MILVIPPTAIATAENRLAWVVPGCQLRFRSVRFRRRTAAIAMVTPTPARAVGTSIRYAYERSIDSHPL